MDGNKAAPDGNRILAPHAVAAILTELPCLLLNASNCCRTGYGVGAFEALVHGIEFCSGTERDCCVCVWRLLCMATVVYGDCCVWRLLCVVTVVYGDCCV